jgi:hypothetical protein
MQGLENFVEEMHRTHSIRYRVMKAKNEVAFVVALEERHAQ